MTEGPSARQRPDGISFDEWLKHVFDHSARGFQRCHDADAEEPEDWNESADPARTVSYLTRLFEDPGFLLNRHTGRQVAQGLWYLIFSGYSEHMFSIRDTSVPWRGRKRCLQSILSLFEKLFAPVCADHYGHLDWGPQQKGPLNDVCYMWWDVIAIDGSTAYPDRDDGNKTVLGIVEGTLKIPSIACQESALHGLGHWEQNVPHAVQRISESLMPF